MALPRQITYTCVDAERYYTSGARLRGVERLVFGCCRSCGHEVVLRGGGWKHHITRSALLGLPHWPTGHVITTNCKRGCQCSSPEPDESKGRKSKLVFLGLRTDR
ncbi:MAG: hypothetical protein JRM85_03925 [Nitrososphaerota archaeon]|nr:hypothetical protein [Nitrososphaerota archaeon]MDG6919343.1 hypothetical protein [Nitrososphaerota archaeon]